MNEGQSAVGAARDRAVRHWRLVPDGPEELTPSGYVGFMRQGERQVVLKVPDPEMDEAEAHRVLEHFAGNGAVGLLDRIEGASLLERATPGSALTALVVEGRDDEATGILCDTAAALARSGPLGEFPTVERWGNGFARHRKAGRGGIGATLLDRAEALFFELAASQAEPVLLHGDLHHDNILLDSQRGWLAIDPKGVVGEPAYEMGAMMRNPVPDTALFARTGIIERRIALIAEHRGFDRQRLAGWTLAQAVLSAVWSIEDGQDPRAGLATAEAALPVVQG